MRNYTHTDLNRLWQELRQRATTAGYAATAEASQEEPDWQAYAVQRAAEAAYSEAARLVIALSLKGNTQ